MRTSFHSHIYRFLNNATFGKSMFFFGMAYKKKYFLYHIINTRNDSTRANLATTLSDGLFLDQFGRYKFEIFTQFVLWFENSCNKFWIKVPKIHRIYSVSDNAVFVMLSPINRLEKFFKLYSSTWELGGLNSF